MGIPTEQSLKLLHSRRDRRIARRATHQQRARQVVECMRRCGSALYAYFQLDVLHYVLSDNSRASEAVGRLVTEDPHVVGVGDALFGSVSAQTFRYVNEEKG